MSDHLIFIGVGREDVSKKIFQDPILSEKNKTAVNAIVRFVKETNKKTGSRR